MHRRGGSAGSHEVFGLVHQHLRGMPARLVPGALSSSRVPRRSRRRAALRVGLLALRGP